MNEEFIRYPGTYRTAQEAMVADLNKQLETIAVLRKQLEVATEAIENGLKTLKILNEYKGLIVDLEYSLAEINRIGKVEKSS